MTKRLLLLGSTTRMRSRSSSNIPSLSEVALTEKELLAIMKQLGEHERKLDSLLVVLCKVIESVHDLEEEAQGIMVVVEEASFPAAHTKPTYQN